MGNGLEPMNDNSFESNHVACCPIIFLHAGKKQMKFSCGKFTGTALDPGLTVIMPCVDEIKYVVDTRSMNLEIHSLDAQSKDKIELIVSGQVAVRCIDAHKACFSVAHCLESIRIYANSSARTCIGKMTMQEILDNRSLVSAKVQEELIDDLKGWGFTIRAFEITDISPKDKRVKEALKLQITAEQDSKEKHIQADSQVLSTKNKTDSEKFELVKKAEAYQLTNIKEAEGDQKRKVLKAEAEAESMKMLVEASGVNGGLDVLKMRIAQEQIDCMGALSKNSNNKLILPYDITDAKSFINIGEGLI